jgi:hypothetical protein
MTLNFIVTLVHYCEEPQPRNSCHVSRPSPQKAAREKNQQTCYLRYDIFYHCGSQPSETAVRHHGTDLRYLMRRVVNQWDEGSLLSIQRMIS